MKTSLGRRSAASVVDQVASSATNFIVLFAALRVLSIESLGVFTFAYTGVLALTTVMRAYVMQPLAVRFHQPANDQGKEVSNALGVSMVAATFVIAVGAAVGIFGPSSFGYVPTATGLAAGGLFLQDGWRNYFFVSATPSRAVLNDLIRFGATLAPVSIFVSQSGLSVSDLLIAWAIGAFFAAAVGWIQSGIGPSIRGLRQWMLETRSLGMGFAGSIVIERVAVLISFATVGHIVGSAALGGIGAARTLMSPITTLANAADIFVLPEISRLRRTASHRDVIRLAIVASASVGLAVICFVLTTLIIPASWGKVLGGSNWLAGMEFVLPIGIWTAVSGARIGARSILRAWEKPRTVLLLSIFVAIFLVPATAVGSSVAPIGAAWAVAGTFVASLCLWWMSAIRTIQTSSS
jgi:O-antigen/teichoic acid export membrane protein